MSQQPNAQHVIGKLSAYFLNIVNAFFLRKKIPMLGKPLQNIYLNFLSEHL